MGKCVSPLLSCEGMSAPTQKVRLYVDPAWRTEGVAHSPLLYPFWGNPLDPERFPFQHALFSQHSFDTSYYELTDDSARADVVFLPYNHTVLMRDHRALWEQGKLVSRESGKPLLIDAITDQDLPVEHENAIILRYGGYRFLPDSRVIIVPPFTEDLLERYGDGILTLRDKQNPPRIGFAGWGSLTHTQRIRAVLKELPERLRGLIDTHYRAMKKGVFFREQALVLFESSPDITPHFLARTSYSGHVKTASGDMRTLREQFVDNLRESDYGLDIRGDANASTRLFEMLSLGCIPLIIDTERNYPFSDRIDYRSFSFTVDFRDLKKAPQLIRAFHDSLTNEEFRAMQERTRAAYIEYFRIDSITPHLMEEIRRRAT